MQSQFCNVCLMIAIVLSNFAESYKSRYDLLELTLSGVTKTFEYYENNYHNMNLDGVFGLRLIQGQVMQITDALKKLNKDLSTLPLLIRLEKLGKKAGNLATKSLRYLEKDSSEYLKKLDWVILNPWTFASSEFRNINPKKRAIYDEATVIVPKDTEELERISDSCLSGLLKHPAKCHLSKICLRFLMNRKSAGYELTHQLLLIMAVHMINCTQKVTSITNIELGQSLSEYQDELCTKSFYETSEILSNHPDDIPSYYKDLFLEELMVCPMFGYYQFLHEKWLLDMLSWQSESGCWKQMWNENNGYLSDELERLHTGRKLLYEKLLPDGCSSHLTTVAFGALTQFLRFLVLCELASSCGVRIPITNFLINPHSLPYISSSESGSFVSHLMTFSFVLMFVAIITKTCHRRIIRLLVLFRRSIC